MTRFTISRKPFEATLNNFVDDLFNDLPVAFKNDFNKNGSNEFTPVNVKETENSYQLEVVAPGFEKTDFKVNVDRDLLTISASKESVKKEGEKEKLIRREYNFRPFKRSFTIDEKIDATKIEASYVNGVLVVNLPKKEEVNVSAKQIEIF